jgi:hypothetical protein
MFKHWKLPVVLTLVTGLMIGAAGTASAQTMDTDFTDIPIEGTIPGTANTFEGALDVTRFAADGGTLTIIGQLTGEITDADGALVATVNEAVQVPVDISQVSQQVCDILLLELGPIDLDLLGLVVNVSPITINIDAEQGTGNLLGNLLCAVAGLLDPDGASDLTQALARLLNRILSILG